MNRHEIESLHLPQVLSDSILLEFEEREAAEWYDAERVRHAERIRQKERARREREENEQ